MIWRSIASVADQALLSGFNFLVGIYLISAVSKADYGLYVQLFAIGVLFCGVIDALIANAIANLIARHSSDDMIPKIAVAVVLARLLGAGLALTAGVLAMGLQQNGAVATGHAETALAFVGYVGTLTLRDFKRVLLFLQHRAFDVLRIDSVFVAVALLGGAFMHTTENVSLFWVFCLLGAANAMAVWSTPRLTQGTSVKWPMLQAGWSECWAITRWALPGLAMGWLGNSLYLYLAGFQLGLQATAELNASRLILMPIALLTVAWQQMARADVAHLIKGGNQTAFFPFFRRSALVIFVPMVVYLCSIFLFYEWVVRLVSADKYQHFTELLSLWIVYLVIYAVKFMGTVLMVGFGAFKSLLKVNFASVGLQCVLLLTIPPMWGIQAVVVCLMASELLEALLIWGRLLPRHFRDLSLHNAVAG